jgi:hypothetical protein
MAVLFSKFPQKIPTFSIPRPSKIYPNWYFWFNPGLNSCISERNAPRQFEEKPGANPTTSELQLPTTPDVGSRLERFQRR